MTIQIFEAVEQGSEEWKRVRMGVPTASEFHAVLAKGEGKTRKSYMLRLAAEIVMGEPLETFKSQAMERGNEMEPKAREMYCFMHDATPTRVGFIRNGPKGCSPDSLLGVAGALEIKTQRGDLLIETLLRDEFPSEHKAQCQGVLWVAEREWVDIAVYWPRMPLFTKRAFRDEVFITRLASAVDQFNEELAAMVERVKRYGMPMSEAAE